MSRLPGLRFFVEKVWNNVEKMWKNGECELYNSRYAFVRFGIDG